NTEAVNDADVFMTGVENVTLFGYGGDDRIRGEPRIDSAIGRFYDLPLTIFGGSGDDLLWGTQLPDTIYAGTGADFVVPDSANGYVNLQDGVGGNDLSAGVAGTCVVDPGDLCSDGSSA